MPSRSGTVAIVDDDPAVCDSTRILLEVHDLDVRTYLSGPDFLRETRDIACLVVDYQMPGLNGIELVFELRKRGRNIRTIMITATSDPRVERRAAEVGIKHVLKKPFQIQVLMSAIHEELQ